MFPNQNKIKDISLAHSENFQPIGRVLYMSTDKNKNKKIKTENLDLVIDTVFKPYATNTVTQDGIVRYLDKSKVQIDVEVGDLLRPQAPRRASVGGLHGARSARTHLGGRIAVVEPPAELRVLGKVDALLPRAR